MFPSKTVPVPVNVPVKIMNKNIAISFDSVGKQYRLGLVSTGTISHDLNRWWAMNVLHKEDPYLKIGDTNDRSTKGESDYVWALKDINFKVEEGDVVGIIGKNGAGKSTLLKLLSRVTAPTVGNITYRGRIASLLEVGTGFHPEMTGRENIYMNGAIMGMTKAEITRKLDEIVDFSGCERYIDTPVKRYSSGMTVRLGFAVAAFLEPEILVVDEVLAVGDAEFQKKAIGKMQDVSKGEGRTVLFVSHNMAAVRSLCKNGFVLKNGQIDFIGSANECVDYYLSLGKNRIEGDKLIKSFKIKDKALHINKVIVNGNDTDVIELNYPDRTIDIEIQGHYADRIPMDIELSLYSENEVLIAKKTPSLSTGESHIINSSDFRIAEKIVLPQFFTNGMYYMTIEITHPKVSYLAVAEQALQINVTGNITSQGISVDRNIFGFIYL